MTKLTKHSGTFRLEIFKESKIRVVTDTYIGNTSVLSLKPGDHDEDCWWCHECEKWDCHHIQWMTACMKAEPELPLDYDPMFAIWQMFKNIVSVLEHPDRRQPTLDSIKHDLILFTAWRLEKR